MHHSPEFRSRDGRWNKGPVRVQAQRRCWAEASRLNRMHAEASRNPGTGRYGYGPSTKPRVWRLSLEWGGVWLYCAGTLVVAAVWMRLILAGMGVLVLV